MKLIIKRLNPKRAKGVNAALAGMANAFRADGYELSVMQPKELWEIAKEYEQMRSEQRKKAIKTLNEKRRELGIA